MLRQGTLLTFFAFVSINCGALVEDETPAPSSREPGAETKPAPPPENVPPPTNSPPPSNDPVCTPFALGDALAKGGEWSFAERVMGDGWLRIHLTSGATSGTTDYVPGVADGLFSCTRTSATMSVDEATRTVTLVFPPPCSTFIVTVDPKACVYPSSTATLRAGFAMTDQKTGIVSTEGVLERFAGGHCDAAFTSCTY